MRRLLRRRDRLRRQNDHAARWLLRARSSRARDRGCEIHRARQHPRIAENPPQKSRRGPFGKRSATGTRVPATRSKSCSSSYGTPSLNAQHASVRAGSREPIHAVSQVVLVMVVASRAEQCIEARPSRQRRRTRCSPRIDLWGRIPAQARVSRPTGSTYTPRNRGEDRFRRDHWHAHLGDSSTG